MQGRSHNISTESCGPLAGTSARLRVCGEGRAAARARELLADLGAVEAPIGTHGAVSVELGAAPDPETDWAESGAMALTGRANGPALAAVGEPATAVRAALAVFAALTRVRIGTTPDLPGPSLLAERAAISGLSRSGPWSCGGASRVLPARDGWVCVSLARDDDLTLIPALVEEPATGDAWDTVASWVRRTDAEDVVSRAQLLGLPAAAVPDGTPEDEQMGHRRAQAGSRRTGYVLSPGGQRRSTKGKPLVVDLTSLWAGPLCAHLLGLADADVVKVESIHRPDGARNGSPEFFDLLHAGHEAVALDFGDPGDLDLLRSLIEKADLVLEASRPRALRHLGVNAAAAVAKGTSWISITGYGRTGPWSERVAFGDDAAAAAGLVAHDGAGPMPCGDAIADPLAGVHAAAAAAAVLLSPSAWLVDVAMRDVAVLAAQAGASRSCPHPSPRPPRIRLATAPAQRLGEDTFDVLDRLGLR